MEPSLLATKLRIPPQRQGVVGRVRLIESLERELPRYKLILLSVPAGYGKTTLLAQWAHCSSYPVAWLSLGEEDNDLERFFRYLLAAWQAIQPSIIESELGLLLGAMSPDSEAVLSAFINAADDIAGDTVFVLDDYHLIDEPSIHQALIFLLDHLPPTLHFVLAGRAEPLLPLARYRARQELLEFHAEDLNFSTEEASDFLNEKMGLDLSRDEVASLHAQVEGWIAGLQLAALSLQRHPDNADKLAITGKHRFIADYLSEDVLTHLPSRLRQFLLQTSILDQLSGPLCDAVTAQEDGQEMLERLERENLFLMPLDDSREWFRYHRLFADFLQEALKRRYPDEVAGLHRRAAGWYLARDLPEQAFRHAVAADDVKVVVRIFERYVNAKLNSGELKVVKRWIDALPAAWFAAYPVLGLGRAGFLAYTGDFGACVRCVDDIEQGLALVESEDRRWQMARVTAVRCYMACAASDLSRAESFADQALRELPEEDLNYRPLIYGALGDTYRRSGRWQEARECYLKTLDFADSPAVRVLTAHVFGALADLDLRQGRLRDAAGYWGKALAVVQERESQSRLELPVIGWLFIRLGEILYEWDELSEAGDHLTRGLERAELGGDPKAIIAGYLLAGRLKLAAGDIVAASDYLELARPLIENAPFPDWVGRFGRFQLELWLAQDRLRAAVQWADEVLEADGQPQEGRPPEPALSLPKEAPLQGQMESEEAQLAMARVLIVKGDGPSLERALALLSHLLQTAEAEGRMGVEIEALALQSLAHWRRGEQASAMTSLERALRLAEPEGYVRLFADLGLPMARLLQEARSRDVMQDYVGKLLAAFDGYWAGTRPAPTAALPEPLTAREQEILELLAAGLTNREIGEELVISPQTVKKHTGNIYGKLGTGNRTETVSRARELELLD